MFLHLCLQTGPTMRSVCVCFCLALLLPWCVRSQRSSPALAKLDEDTQRDVLAVDILNRSGMLNSLLQSEYHTVLRRARAPRPVSQVPKRAQQGSRFALSLDVPTSILSVLIDLAKNQDMRTKAASNAELLARIGKRKWKAPRSSFQGRTGNDIKHKQRDTAKNVKVRWSWSLVSKLIRLWVSLWNLFLLFACVILNSKKRLLFN